MEFLGVLKRIKGFSLSRLMDERRSPGYEEKHLGPVVITTSMVTAMQGTQYPRKDDQK